MTEKRSGAAPGRARGELRGIAQEAERLYLGDRLALRPTEAARALGVSERTLRGLLPELPHFRAGGVVLLPVEALREWLRERVQSGKSRVDGIADDVLGSFDRGRDDG